MEVSVRRNVRTARRPFPTHILVFLAPAVIVYTIFMIYPLFDSVNLSLYAAEGTKIGGFVGLRNYRMLLTDPQWAPRFWGALRNNVVFFLFHMFIQNPLGLLLAVLLDSRTRRGRAIYRTILFAPTVLSFVIVGFIWQLILSPLWGVAGSLLKLVGLGKLFKPWLGLESTVLPTLSLISIWQFVGIPMMLFLTALLSIPDELEEAARVGGATAWSTFWRVKFPLLLPTVGIVTVLTFVGNFNAFDLVYAVKGALAGPNFASDLLGTLFYRTFFGFQLQPGNPAMGTTVAMMIFLIILTGVLLYLFLWQRRVVTYEL